MNLSIGDKIRDIEDGDCFYEGTVSSLTPLKYRIERIIWDGELDESMNGQTISPKWWKIEKIWQIKRKEK